MVATPASDPADLVCLAIGSNETCRICYQPHVSQAAEVANPAIRHTMAIRHTCAALLMANAVPSRRISEIVDGKRRISADTAWRLVIDSDAVLASPIAVAKLEQQFPCWYQSTGRWSPDPPLVAPANR